MQTQHYGFVVKLNTPCNVLLVQTNWFGVGNCTEPINVASIGALVVINVVFFPIFWLHDQYPSCALLHTCRGGGCACKVRARTGSQNKTQRSCCQHVQF